MQGIFAAGAISCVLAFVPGPAARADDAGGVAHEKVYELYCGGCHGLGGTSESVVAPDLSVLTHKYGAPLPTAQLVDFVMGDRRLGGMRICGEHTMRPAPFNDTAERSTVRAALRYVSAVQREQ